MEPIRDKATLSIEAAVEYLGIGRAHLYRLLGSGDIPSLHIGRRRFFLRLSLDRYLEERMEVEVERIKAKQRAKAIAGGVL